jgi:hypothetical protein
MQIRRMQIALPIITPGQGIVTNMWNVARYGHHTEVKNAKLGELLRYRQVP